MEDDAIREDVSEEREEYLSERDRKLQELMDSRDQDDEVVEEVVEEAVDEGPVIEFYDGDKVYKVPATARYKAKIDGEETETEVDKIARSYQKGAAADRRLEEAARKQKELADYEQALAQRLQALREQEARQQAPSPPKGGDKRAAAERIYKAILDESDDPVAEIAKALGELSPDEDAIIRRAEERTSRLLTERERATAVAIAEKKRAEANQWFTDNYPDIIGDKHLVGRAAQLGAERIAQAHPDDYKRIVQEIGDELTEWVKSKSPSHTTREKPRSTPQPRTATPPKKPDEQPETRADIFAEIRRTRGLPT